MQRFVILASVVVLAAASANCGNSDRNVLSPSAVSDDAATNANNKGGGGVSLAVVVRPLAEACVAPADGHRPERRRSPELQ